LQSFVKDLESRPTERLLRDLPDLVGLSEAKAEIITYVVASRDVGRDGDGVRAAFRGDLGK